jgi:uncharacterized protein
MNSSEKERGLNGLTPEQLLLNVYLTQALFILLALGIGALSPFRFQWKIDHTIPLSYLYMAGATGIIVPIISNGLKRIVPKEWFDDGGINEKIFGSLSYAHIFILSVIIAFSEEWLFRGVLQPLIGYLFTSLIFSLLHIRYIKKPILFALATLLSFWLGLLYLWTESLWIPFIAHFFIDFISGCSIAKQYKKRRFNSRNGE